MDLLFSEHDLSVLLTGLERKLGLDIQAQDGDYVLNASETDLVAYYVDEYSLAVPELHEDAIYVREQTDAKIDVSRDPGRDFMTPGPHYLPGTKITIAVPFSGDSGFFRYRPNHCEIVDKSSRYLLICSPV